MRKIKLLIAKIIVKTVQQIQGTYDRINVYKLRGEFRQLGKHVVIEGRCSVMNPQCISIGDNLIMRAGVKLRAYTGWEDTHFTPEIIIGNHVHLATDAVINCTHRVEIRDHAGIGVGSKIMDHSHGLPDYSDLDVPVMKRIVTSKGGVIIGTNVMVGTGVVIFAGVEIGANSIIGSNSVVTRSIPPNSIAAGIPARVIKTIEKDQPVLQS